MLWGRGASAPRPARRLLTRARRESEVRRGRGASVPRLWERLGIANAGQHGAF